MVEYILGNEKLIFTRKLTKGKPHDMVVGACRRLLGTVVKCSARLGV